MSRYPDTAGLADLADLADVSAFVLHAAVLDIIHSVERRHSVGRGDLLGLGFEVAAHVLQKYDGGKYKRGDKEKGLCVYFRKSLDHAAARESGWNPPRGLVICGFEDAVTIDRSSFEARAEEEQEPDVAMRMSTEHRTHPLVDEHDDHDRLRRKLTAAQREMLDLFRPDTADQAGVTRRCIQQHRRKVLSAAPGGADAALAAAQGVLKRLRRPRQMSLDLGSAS